MNTPQDADAYYRDLTERNRGLIPDEVQQRLRTSKVLVAGCGSTGGAAIEPLARLGLGAFVLTEPGEYELNNLNRQSANRADIGRNKAEVGADRVRAIHPFAEVTVDTGGVQADNAALLLDGVDVVVDGVDVTTVKGWQAKYTLHAEASRLGVPVVSGYDMSGTQHIRYYDYRIPQEPLAGEVTEKDLAQETLWDLLLKVIPRSIVPADLIADIVAHRGEVEYSVPQLVYASHLFGVLASRYVVEVLAGNPVRGELTVDVHSLVTPQSQKELR
ncbi:ThiF family adenylyltransferase [Actinacidiphila sp. ITFR-21]|uniref:ThiF family adenylyltransferase n=1 Tax=Actinacidiphila sp. ITFR-21 TaxID=3075199 RepID=UPI00288B9E2E|nr:ThiF family adenylyltransferase [Streptomyces sp. ITFR-21]WNI17992.1 ThiF family adenylyltransferase [Streptomyces sp. ITFR-21]